MKIIGKLKTLNSSEIKKSRVGIGFECVDRDLIKPEKCYDLFAATGAKWARCQTGWAKCEKEKGVYDFSWLDDMVDNLRQRGVEVWFNVGYGNPIYMKDITNPTAVGCVPTLYGEEVITAWKNYITALAEHFKGRVLWWEIWNEPDGKGFWYPGTPNAREYAELIKLTGGIIKQSIPGAKIAMCTSGSHLDYLKEAFSVLDAGDIALYNIHTYHRHPETCPRSLRAGEIRALLDECGLPDVEIGMGEVGHASWHPVGHYFVNEGGGSESRQAIYAAREFFLDFMWGLKFTSWFIIADIAEKVYQTATRNEKRPSDQGLLHGRIYTPKKAHEVVSYLGVLLSGETVLSEKKISVEWGKTAEDSELVAFSYTRDGKDLYVYWNPLPVESDEPVKMGNTVHLPETDIDDPILIDTYSGAVIIPEDGEWCKENSTLTNVPLAIYPFVITSRDSLKFNPI